MFPRPQRHVASILLLSAAVSSAGERSTDLDACENCAAVPAALLEIDSGAKIDLAGLAGERLLDFLVGEWELWLPPDDRGVDSVDWLVDGHVIEGTQFWNPDGKGGYAFVGKALYSYDNENDRWSFLWLQTSGGGSSSVFSGGLEGEEIVLREFDIEGRSDRGVDLVPSGSLFVFHSITNDRFVADWYDRSEGDPSKAVIRFRTIYRRKGTTVRPTTGARPDP